MNPEIIKEMLNRFPHKVEEKVPSNMTKEELSQEMEKEYQIINEAKARIGLLEAEVISRYAPELIGREGM